jgi:hypothetical protein
MDARADDSSQPGALAALMALDGAAGRLWEPGELSAILRHQLAAPLEMDLAMAGLTTAEKVSPASAPPGDPIRSFGDLLHHRDPPIELLVLVKDFAKAARQDPSVGLPGEVAGILYFASIVVARRRWAKRITRLDDEEVEDGVRWALAEPWVDEATRSLFEPNA